MASAKHGAATGCRLLLGGLFLLAGVAKAGHIVELSQNLANYILLPAGWELPLATLLPALEAGVGLALLLGLFTRLASGLALLLISGFTLFVSSALARGLNIECGCFSGASKVSWLHLVLNLGLLVLAAGAFRFGGGRWAVDQHTGRGKRAGLALAVIALGAVVARWPEQEKPSSPPPMAARLAPNLIFEPPALDLGDVPAGRRVKRTVAYRNADSQPISIAWAQSSCGCTTVHTSTTPLDPGQSGQLTVEYKAGPESRAIAQKVRLYQHGRQLPAVLEVRGRVTQPNRLGHPHSQSFRGE